MLSSILTSILRVTKKVKIPGGNISLGVTARQTYKTPKSRKTIRTR